MPGSSLCWSYTASRAGVAFLLDDQRNVYGLFVHEETVLLLAVIAEAFPVVGQQDNGRPVVELVRLQVPHEPADDFIAVGDLAVVRVVCPEALRRCVRLVRLVQMQKQKRAGGSNRRE